MLGEYLLVQESNKLEGTVELTGAKNAVLVIIASLILTKGTSTLYNVPNSADVICLLGLMRSLGAIVVFDVQNKKLTVDTSMIMHYEVSPDVMNKMRASILVMGPLLARFGKARVALPGGCLIGSRPIDYHLTGFKKLGIELQEEKPYLTASVRGSLSKKENSRIIFEYPSVGATENIMMFATLKQGQTVLVNAALEPEVLDLIDVLKKMGAKISCDSGANITIEGVNVLHPVEHTVIPDRLEAGGLLLAAAISKGSIYIPNARADHMDMFLEKLREMGHDVIVYENAMQGVKLIATHDPVAVNIKTAPYPGFPTDLQAPMMAMLTLCKGISVVEETVFENRLMHVAELGKMGAQISITGQKATVRGVDFLYGSDVIATDIRASCALVLAGLRAKGVTKISNVHHWRRGYDKLEEKLRFMGATLNVISKVDSSAASENRDSILL